MLGCSPTTEGNCPGVHCTKLSSGEADRRVERLTEQSHGPLRRYHWIYVVPYICRRFIPTVHAIVLWFGTWSAHFTWSRASSAAVHFTASFCHVHVVVCPSSYIVSPFYFYHWLGSTPCRTAVLVSVSPSHLCERTLLLPFLGRHLWHLRTLVVFYRDHRQWHCRCYAHFRVGEKERTSFINSSHVQVLVLFV